MASIPAVHALERRFHGRGLRLIGVTDSGQTDEERAEVERTAKKHKMTSPTYLDIDGSFAKASGLGSNPAFMVVGKDGRSVHRESGQLTEGSEQYKRLEQAIERALASK